MYVPVCSRPRVFGLKRLDASEILGQGVHALQDIDAHMDWGVGWSKVDKVHRVSNSDESKNELETYFFDNPDYDIVKQRGRYYHKDYVGERGSQRYSNSVNATRWYYENFLNEIGGIK